MRIVTIIIATLFISNCFSQNKISAQKLITDFDYLISELRLQHQGLYQYVDKHKVDQKLDSLRQTIKTPLSKLKFYQTVRSVVSLTNEGHTYTTLPKWEMIKVGLSKSFLPLGLVFLDKELIITQNYGKDVSGLKKGMKIISINEKSIEEITKTLFPLIPTDGFNETSKYEWGGGINLSLLYRLIYGEEKYFDLEVIAYENKTSQKIRIPSIRYPKFKTKNTKFKSKKFEYDDFSYRQINDSIAYLSIPSFGDDIKYENYYRSVFKKIDSLNIKHLILDIQANNGGTEGNENLLFSYLSDSVIKKYKKVTMFKKPYSKNKDDEDYRFDKWQLKGSLAERGDFTLSSDYYSNLEYSKPSKNIVFHGNLYVLTSGITFSGGAEFASMIKMTQRGIFIGEETGGTYEGNVSGYSETIKLPNSKIMVDIPTVHFQINVSPKIKGRGIMPDYLIPQKWEDYMNDKNAKLDFVTDFILKK